MKRNKFQSKIYSHQLKVEAYKRFTDAGVMEWYSVTHSVDHAQRWAAEGITAKEYKEIIEKSDIQKDVCIPDWWGGWKRRMGAEFTVAEALRQMRRKYPAPQRTR